MHELTRRAYLDALGIDSYVSRSQLVGAAPTRRLALVPRPAAQALPRSVMNVEAPRTENPAPAARPRQQESKPSPISELLPQAAPQQQVEPSPAPQNSPEPQSSPVGTPAEAFSVAAVVAGNWLWLEQLTGPALFQDQQRLIQAMVQALGWPAGPFEVSRFDWPLHTNAQLDLGEEAARACLGGFVGRKLDQLQCAGVVLLGSACQLRLPPTNINAGKCVATVSTAEMLANPLLKKQAWQDLSSHVQRS